MTFDYREERFERVVASCISVLCIQILDEAGVVRCRSVRPARRCLQLRHEALPIATRNGELREHEGGNKVMPAGDRLREIALPLADLSKLSNKRTFDGIAHIAEHRPPNDDSALGPGSNPRPSSLVPGD